MGSYYKSEFGSVAVANQPLHLKLLDLVAQHASQERVAFISATDGSTCTYRQLWSASLSLNAFLHERRFGHRDVAGGVMQNCWEFGAAVLGVMSRGGCFSAASPLFTTVELAQQFRDAKCKVVFCMEYSLKEVLKTKEQCPSIKTIIVTDGPEHNLPTDVYHMNWIISSYNPATSRIFTGVDLEKDMVALPYSSGTTGAPKGVMLTHKGFGTLLNIATNHLDLQIFHKIDPNWDYAKERSLSVLPFYHIYGFGMLWAGVVLGMTTVVMRKYEPRLLLKSIQDHKIRYVCLVPPILVYLSRTNDVKDYDLSSLAFVMTGAAPLGAEVIELVKKRLPTIKQISQAYGMTEESMCSHLPVFGTDNPAASGRLMSNYEMKVIDTETGRELPAGKVGEILIRSPTIMLGYFNRPKATAETIDAEGFLHTGDLGYTDAAGWTYVVDRIKELIKVKGLQVAPAELEELLLGSPQVRDCAVVGVPHARHGEVPKAFVVRADPTLTEDQVKNFVSGKVAPYKRLAAVEFVSEIPKSPSGKILRRYLRQAHSKI